MHLQLLNITPPAVLKNQALQAELNREGIISFPFLNPEELARLQQLYKTLHPVPPQGPIENFYVSTHSAHLPYKKAVDSGIRDIIKAATDAHFQQYRITASVFVVKSPSPHSELRLHQDWNVVDELKYASYGLWIPLVDVTAHNGAIFALKRTHRLGPTYRHSALPSVHSNLADHADHHLVPFEVKAGYAVLFNQAILHKSTPNLSTDLRTSIVNTIVPENAPHLMYVRQGQTDKLDVYQIPDDTVQHYTSFLEDSIKVPAGAVKMPNPVQANFTLLHPHEFENLYQLLLKEN